MLNTRDKIQKEYRNSISYVPSSLQNGANTLAKRQYRKLNKLQNSFDPEFLQYIPSFQEDFRSSEIAIKSSNFDNQVQNGTQS